MNEIQLKKKNGKQVVSAKELHKALEIKENFEQWTMANIQNDNVYIEDIDYFPKHRIVECEVAVSVAKLLVIKELGRLNKRIWEILNSLNQLEEE